MTIVQRIIEERNGDNKHKDCVANDVVDVLLEVNKGELKKMSENIIEMMIPGEETLPTAMTMAVKFLSDSPHALSKLVVSFSVFHIFLINNSFFREENEWNP